MSEKLEIRKGGKLIETKWVYDETIKEGSYKEFDRTDQAIKSLFDICELSSDVTLKDIFQLLNTELDLFDVVIGNWCKEIVTEGLTQPETPYDLSIYNADQIEYLELKFSPEYDNDGPGTKDYLVGFDRPDLNATGVELQADKDHFKKGERIPWGVCFTPSNELINIPVKLAKDVVIYEGLIKRKKGIAPVALATFDNPVYTLGNILQGIIWELSFHGAPEDRDSIHTEIKDTVEKIKKDGSI